ncbi:MAG: hypothetical protein K0Q72_2807 [Armatimonadetes bacterium]|nr:hypothetical protein [Armatimonadota bacterium]
MPADGKEVPELGDDLDKNYHLPVYSQVCTLCRHLDRTVPRAFAEERGKCKAFPDAIPDEIWLGRHRHRDPYPGDHGVRFEEISVEELEALIADAESG